MKISLKCSCGAEATWEDDKGIQCSVPFGSHHDAKGRRYQIEVQAQEWLDRHQGCPQLIPEGAASIKNMQAPRSIHD